MKHAAVNKKQQHKESSEQNWARDITQHINLIEFSVVSIHYYYYILLLCYYIIIIIILLYYYYLIICKSEKQIDFVLQIKLNVMNDQTSEAELERIPSLLLYTGWRFVYNNKPP